MAARWQIRRAVELPVLLAGLIVAGCAWGFVELAELAQTTPHGLDTRILLAFRTPGDPATPIGPAWMTEAVRDVTGLGGTVVIVFVVAVTLLYLLIDRKPALALFVLIAAGGGQILSSVLKSAVDRPRPDIVPHLVEVYTLSFPSGHAMLSAVTYLTLGALLARIAPSRALKIYVLAVAVVATLAIGVSRIYLGVHWPSDVLAGWCAGFAWATLCWLAARWLLRSRASGIKNDA